uniref:Uncharacterized protein n=1 Tax=Lepeophtheirus salmonis TaxID=72036 RepID=A0A0K2TED6_LEPSM
MKKLSFCLEGGADLTHHVSSLPCPFG